MKNRRKSLNAKMIKISVYLVFGAELYTLYVVVRVRHLCVIGFRIACATFYVCLNRKYNILLAILHFSNFLFIQHEYILFGKFVEFGLFFINNRKSIFLNYCMSTIAKIY